MQVYFAPAFLRTIKRLDPPIKRDVKTTIDKVIDLYESGDKSGGLGIKHLRGDLWEARSGIRIRIVYGLDRNAIRFLLAGSHDDVKNFLKHA